ncbi:alpha-ribazole-5-phosphate synthase [Planomicrobium sp. CPCC 101110]|uniref:alpha-ribazole-5-phosphate synthase n=1 Tax=Planomicrobium sp. CPCC 101110 TaxID=2599619 RepID=UPI00164498AE|nr:alpha-ribazole-5-phosphate synthase [Planomicrobium sp. CPCC 101110]
MRHELMLGEWVITSDNSGGIGEKPMDFVQAPDRLTAKFAARVALLEQWAAGSEPEAVLLHNFSGEEQWLRYIAGVEDVFAEARIENVQISGSSETNIATLQSAIAVTMLGRRKQEGRTGPLEWYVYGVPLVGEAVLLKAEQLADLKKLSEARASGLIESLWPIGSKGIGHEARRLFGEDINSVPGLDIKKSAGPSTCVLIGFRKEMAGQLSGHFGKHLYPIHR